MWIGKAVWKGQLEWITSLFNESSTSFKHDELLNSSISGILRLAQMYYIYIQPN